MKSFLLSAFVLMFLTANSCGKADPTKDMDGILRDLVSADLVAHERALKAIAARIDKADATYMAPMAKDPDLHRAACALANVLADPNKSGFSLAGKDSVPPSIRQEDLTVTFVAPRLLARMGDEIVPYLVATLAQAREDFEEKMKAAREKHERYVSSFGSLEGLYIETSPGVYSNPAIELTRQLAEVKTRVEATFDHRTHIRPFPIQTATTLFGNDKWSVRWSAVELATKAYRCQVQQSGKLLPFPLKEFASMLGDTNHFVRAAAVEALSETRSPAAAAALVKSLRNDYKLMYKIEEALVNLGPDAVPALVETSEFDDSSHMLRIAWVLGRIGEPALPQLLSIFRKDRGESRDMAEEALVKIGLPAVKPLIGMLQADGGEECRNAVVVLGRIRELQAAPPLIESLKDADQQLSKEIVLALRRIIGEPICYTIEKRKAMAKALRQRGYKNAQWWQIKQPWENFGHDYQKWSQWWSEHGTKLLETTTESRPDETEQNKSIQATQESAPNAAP